MRLISITLSSQLPVSIINSLRVVVEEINKVFQQHDGQSCDRHTEHEPNDQHHFTPRYSCL